MNIARYNKAIVGIVGAILTWAIATYANDPEISRWISLASAIATGAGIYQIRNEK